MDILAKKIFAKYSNTIHYIHVILSCLFIQGMIIRKYIGRTHKIYSSLLRNRIQEYPSE